MDRIEWQEKLRNLGLFMATKKAKKFPGNQSDIGQIILIKYWPPTSLEVISTSTDKYKSSTWKRKKQHQQLVIV